MKVIDVLTKIANGENVRFRIIDNDEDDEVRDEIFEVENGHLRNSTCGIWLETEVNHDTFQSISSYFLNKEVEIIEDTKIEKLDVDEEENGKNIIWSTEYEQCNTLEKKIIKRQDYIINKINKIIDYLNKEK